MVKFCAAINCKNQNMNGKNCGFYIFPTDPDRRQEWIYACRKVNADGSRWEPGKYTYLCGEHFISGKPSHDVMNPDYIPSIFNFPSHQQESERERIYREERLAKRKKFMQQKAERMKKLKEQQKKNRTVVKRPYIYDNLKKESESVDTEMKQESVADSSHVEHLKPEDFSADRKEDVEPEDTPCFLTEYFLSKQAAFKPPVGPRIESVFINDFSDASVKEKTGGPTPVFLVKNLTAIENQVDQSVEPKTFYQSSSDEEF